METLLDTGRISQATYDLFSAEMAEATADIERQQKMLLGKLNAKTAELEEQIKTLEVLLANFEIQHVTGEVEQETYEREMNVLTIGLDTSRSELANIKNALEQLSSGNLGVQANPDEEPVIEKPMPNQVETREQQPEMAAQTVAECQEKQ